jgi:hypothetical protein
MNDGEICPVVGVASSNEVGVGRCWSNPGLTERAKGATVPGTLFRSLHAIQLDDRSRVDDYVLLSVHVRFSLARDGPAWARTRALVS